jgi:hypothetical protein
MPAKHLDATVYRLREAGPETWVVEAIDVTGDGACYVDRFTGTGMGSAARERAISYARASYGTVTVEESPDPSPATISPELSAVMDKVRREFGA